jgi:AmmeMemoRadiSam system protein A
MSVRLTQDEGRALVAVARAAIKDRLFEDGSLASARKAIAMTPSLAAPRACFVTLKTPGRSGSLELRGCIGSTEARLPALEAAIVSALDAAFDDPRFPPVAPSEYANLVVSVSALTPIVPVPDASAIVAGTDGVVLECEGRRALFLPEVAAEQGWTRTELLEQLARKAGLPAGAWRNARFSTFQSERFGEDEDEAGRIRRP